MGFQSVPSSRGYPEPSDLQDLRTALAAQSAQNKAPGFGQAGSGYGFLPSGLHALVVIVLPGQDFAVWVVPVKEACQNYCDSHSQDSCYIHSSQLRPQKGKSDNPRQTGIVTETISPIAGARKRWGVF